MHVIAIPFFSDNYAYAVFKPSTQTLVLVDPADWPAVSSFLAAHPDLNRRLTHVFSTHKHHDHSGHNDQIALAHPDVKIVGEAEIPAANTILTDGAELVLEGGIEVRALHTPCHTRGHMLYYFHDSEASAGEVSDAVFTGDTVFVGGCGRFFEGNAAEMWEAMQKLQTLPSETKLYCGHEYTVANLEWASQIERSNEALHAKLAWARLQVAEGKPTVPSSIAEEQSTNVFMRAAALASLLGEADAIATMNRLREMKNSGATL
jgi:hydroxyacylglutathione hydrolase